MSDIEIDKCDFCKQEKQVERTYLHPSKFTKPQFPNNTKPYNDGYYFIIIKTCADCGKPKEINNY